MLSKNLENSSSYGIFYKFWEKARVYYTLSISRGKGRPPPPGFATAVLIIVCISDKVNFLNLFINIACTRTNMLLKVILICKVIDLKYIYGKKNPSYITKITPVKKLAEYN